MKHAKPVFGLIALVGMFATAAPAAAQALDEVIVTAQKREQSAQDIGIALTTLSGDVLEKLGVQSVTDLGTFVPNLTISNQYGSAFPLIFIRGVGLQVFPVNHTSAAAVHVDETYVGLPALLGFQMFDTERVEVLKGPQGTLYGRNTTAGTINFVSRRPSKEFEGYGNLRLGQYDEQRFEGAIGGPISESVQGRIAILYNESDGYMKNEPTGRYQGGTDILAARAQLNVELGPDTDLLFALRGGIDESETFQYTFGSVRCPGGVSPGREPEFNGCPSNLGYIDGDQDPFRVASDLEDEYDNSFFGGTIRASWRPGGYELTSVTSFDSAERAYTDNLDSTPDVIADQYYDEEFEQWSQELRLSSDASDRLYWIAGLYAAYEDIDFFRDLRVDAGTLFGNPAQIGEQVLFDVIANQKTRAYAAFGHAEWQLAERWKLITGVRYTHEEKDFDFFNYNANAANVAADRRIGPVPVVAVRSDVQLEEKWDDVSGKIGLEYEPSGAWLLYLSASKGFKSGGFNSGSTARQVNVLPYDPETVLAYEFGFKSSLLESRLQLNGAVFTYDYEDQQVSAVVPVSGFNVAAVFNSGKSQIVGAEFDLAWRATDRLSLMGSIGWLDTEVEEFNGSIGAVPGSQVVGHELANSPDLSLAARLDYERPLDNGSALGFSINHSYSGHRYFEILNLPNIEAFSRNVLGASVSWRNRSGNLRLSLWGENILDDHYRTYAEDLSFLGIIRYSYGKPETYGVSLDVRF